MARTHPLSKDTRDWADGDYDAAAVTLATATKTTFVVTRGTDGVLVVSPDGAKTHLAPEHVVTAPAPASAVGAGDTLLGVAVAAYVRIFDFRKDLLPRALALGMRAAELTAASPSTVHAAISPAWLEEAALFAESLPLPTDGGGERGGNSTTTNRTRRKEKKLDE
mmetsp:Transcript_19607/g.63014  ORF Transcript_19607/g.63014 Transcript_19607/m.63014 type:complete len:165 (+) Transcript_19607:1725-2219(+)